MATVTFNSIVCNNPSGTTRLDFISSPQGANPVFGPSTMQPNAAVTIGQSRTFSLSGTVRVTVVVNGISSNKSNTLLATPGNINLVFSFPSMTYTVSCTVT